MSNIPTYSLYTGKSPHTRAHRECAYKMLHVQTHLMMIVPEKLLFFVMVFRINNVKKLMAPVVFVAAVKSL